MGAVTLIIELSPESEEQLRQAAARQGQTPEEFARAVVEATLKVAAPLSQQERNRAAAALEQWAKDDATNPDPDPVPEQGPRGPSTGDRWITGEEYEAERQRLLASGHKSNSPEYQALLERIDARNDYLFERYGRPLMEQYRGKWAAISLDGSVEINESELAAMRRGRERFGSGNFCLTRLDDIRGHHFQGPRRDG
jgi:hypothetical protein